ncbi:MAG: hypothetical protein LUE89_01750 [Clostridiales bacterium]|nr:hypothetical protein [Clostridiales bacterium]
MTVNEAIQMVQGKKAGVVNRVSARYAQTLLQPEEQVTAAVVANIQTKRDSFPGVCVLTDQRVIAVCGLPGIKRSVLLSLDELEKCEETNSAITYKVRFLTRKSGFDMTVHPEVGENFSRYIAAINGETFEDIKLEVKSSVFSPTFLRQRQRNKQRKAHAKERQVQRQQEAADRFDAVEVDSAEPSGMECSPAQMSKKQQVATRLREELEQENK